MQFADTSFGNYLGLIGDLRNEILLSLFAQSTNISEVIIKCLEIRSLLRIKCHKAFYPVGGCGPWNITLFPFSNDDIHIQITQMNRSAKLRLKKMVEYSAAGGFSLQRNEGDYLILEGFKYDLHMTEVIQTGFLLFLFIDHMEAVKQEGLLLAGFPMIGSYIDIPYTPNAAKRRLEALLAGK